MDYAAIWLLVVFLLGCALLVAHRRGVRIALAVVLGLFVVLSVGFLVFLAAVFSGLPESEFGGYELPKEVATTLALGATVETDCGPWTFERVGEIYALTRPQAGTLLGVVSASGDPVVVTPSLGPSSMGGSMSRQQHLTRRYELTPSVGGLDRISVLHHECEGFETWPEPERPIVIALGATVETSCGPFTFDRTGDEEDRYALTWPTTYSFARPPLEFRSGTTYIQVNNTDVDLIEPAPLVAAADPDDPAARSPETTRLELRFLGPQVDELTVYSWTCQ